MQSLTTVTCIRKGCGNVCPGGGLYCPECRGEKEGGVVKRSPLELVGNVSGNATTLSPFPGKVTVTLPWSALASDNLRAGVVGEAAREKQAQYKAAKVRSQDKLREQYRGEPFAGPARLHATFYVPNDQRRDVTNFVKLLLDSMVGIVLTDDRWQVLRWTTWGTEGIDVDRPRVEITVEAISVEPAALDSVD